MPGPKGYGPRSLSSAYVNSMSTNPAVLPSTTSNGIPYPGGPKSGCRFVRAACIDFFHAALLRWRGSCEISIFHTLSLGNTVHPVPGTGAFGPRPLIAASDAGQACAGPPRLDANIARTTGTMRSARRMIWGSVALTPGLDLAGGLASLKPVGALAGRDLLGGDLAGLVEHGIHKLGLADLRHNLALSDDEPEPVATGDPHVGLPGLAGTVHHATHHRDTHRNLEPFALD